MFNPNYFTADMKELCKIFKTMVNCIELADFIFLLKNRNRVKKIAIFIASVAVILDFCSQRESGCSI